jgi:ribosome-associated translation inhibitor RaiA
MSDLLQIITLHGVDRSPALEEDIRSRTEKLQQFHRVITSCRVVVERPHKHHHQGGQFVVRLRVSAPGADIVVNHDHSEDVHVALRDAFDAARRQLEDYVSRRDGGAKSHRAARTAPGKRRGIPSD